MAATTPFVTVSSHFVTCATTDRSGGIASKCRQGRLLESTAPSPSSPRRITMSKTSNKIKQFVLFGLASALATGVTTVTPPARADEVTATVFSAPGWDYANVRPSPSMDGQPIGQVQAGQTVQLDCYRYGGEAKAPTAVAPFGTRSRDTAQAGSPTRCCRQEAMRQ